MGSSDGEQRWPHRVRPCAKLPGVVDVAYRCFLSYARTDADGDPYFERFVEDFSKDLRGFLGDPTVEGLVFRDSVSIDLGEKWEAALEQALCVAQVFIAMVSPTYLRRSACSKEWAAFEWRLAKVGGTPRPKLLLPLEKNNETR